MSVPVQKDVVAGFATEIAGCKVSGISREKGSGHIGRHGNVPPVSPLPPELALSGLWSPPAATKVAA